VDYYKLESEKSFVVLFNKPTIMLEGPGNLEMGPLLVYLKRSGSQLEMVVHLKYLL